MHLRGPAAVSAFRLEKLLKQFRRNVPAVTNVSAEYVHFVDVQGSLGEVNLASLKGILQYGRPSASASPRGHLLLVTPRPGTISSWSSKATDIAHNCGLTMVRRLERGTTWHFQTSDDRSLSTAEVRCIEPLIHDRMTEAVFESRDQSQSLFTRFDPSPLNTIDVLNRGIAALEGANEDLGLALDREEMAYLEETFAFLQRDPTDIELMMFAQANSEHCRHKIFNAQWVIDGQDQARSLFAMIRRSHEENPDHILSAYSDNAAVIEGSAAAWFLPDAHNHRYAYQPGEVHIVLKVETHNHPTAISPFPGAATGSGGEIRDEAATGRGARTKAGLCGYSVSNLRIPGFVQRWEMEYGKPDRIASPLEIMVHGPIGSAAFSNEFGRPALCGYFRTYEQEIINGDTVELRGYHKPIMVAGGIGNILSDNIDKADIPDGAKIIVLGGPAMLIGLGGGAASSMASGEGEEELDFASVQRDNAEMQRRCQEVINQCWQLGRGNPIRSIHDVGAGGLSNAVPELLYAAGRGGIVDLRAIPNDEPGMSPMEIWCNEAQERFVLAVATDAMNLFSAICVRERCPYAVVGHTTEDPHLWLHDPHFENTPIDLPLDVVLGRSPKLRREAIRSRHTGPPLSTEGMTLEEAANRVLKLPAVADKTFLITIGDRTVTGLVARDQMIGPWQVPVADCAVTASGYQSRAGEAMAMGERTPLALIDAPASGRMAVGEAITNIAAARIASLGNVALSANWMAACGYGSEDAKLFDTVQAVAQELCPALGIAIPVGKDSLSMRTVWQADGQTKEITAPLSLIISAFAPTVDIRKTLTPQLRTDKGETDLVLVDLGKGQHRLGGSALAQVHNQVGNVAPDLEDPAALKELFGAVQKLNEAGQLLAYHDRSDGGLFVTLCEMAFAGHTGLSISLSSVGDDPLTVLFAEELGVVIQIPRAKREHVLSVLRTIAGLKDHVHVIGHPNPTQRMEFFQGGELILSSTRMSLQRTWSETTFHMQSLRDNPICAREEYDRILDLDDPGLSATLTFDPAEDCRAPITMKHKPRVAILREQGVNGHVEMAAAFDRAGFESADVHMSDILEGRSSLADFCGVASCGGFSYGDVLGAGGGWAKAILHNSRARDEFALFFTRPDTFALGVCNGCQTFSHLHTLIPGTDPWPRFERNASEQFEARLVMCEVLRTPSLFMSGMEGSRLPIVVAHGEGRAEFAHPRDAKEVLEDGIVCVRFISNDGQPARTYPANPNGSPEGITGLTTADGRVTIMMPHPERLFRTVQYSWHPDEWGEDGPWLQMFCNARAYIG